MKKIVKPLTHSMAVSLREFVYPEPGALYLITNETSPKALVRRGLLKETEEGYSLRSRIKAVKALQDYDDRVNGTK